MTNDWMGNWTNKTDEEVYSGAGEQPGSQASYWREVEMKRRDYLLAKKTSEANIQAAEAQIRASDATIDTAYWTKLSAIAVLVTAIIAAVALVVQIASVLK
ncbi:hypothetical protein [Rhizobium sp. AU243]|uniref:hypothetical protein n=1 Tax=Rhizobium sp. AU243 TaxID=2303425 RepID=UPI002570F245|nr:hypothetical protein [Rhizobium sp. AU243]